MAPDVSSSESGQSNFPRQRAGVPVSALQTIERMSRANPTVEVQAGLRARESVSDMASMHRLIARNPFSEEAQKEITRLAALKESTATSLAQEPTATARFDVVSDILLAEPEGEYDKDFNSLYTSGGSPKQGEAQRPEIRKQRAIEEKLLEREMDISAYITADLSLDVKGDMNWFMTHQPQDMYQRLANVAFQTEDYDTIQKQFSRPQRLGYRLAIVNFIRDLEGIKSLHNEIQQRPPEEQAQEIIGHALPLTSPPVIDVNPMGFVIELSGEDYTNTLHSQNLGEYVEGVYTYQPPRSWYSVIFVNRDRISAAPQSKDRTQKEYIVDHEISHAFFNKFARRKVNPPTYDMQREKQEIAEKRARGEASEVTPSTITGSEVLSQIDHTTEKSLELLVNETLSYATGREFPEFKREHKIGGDTITPLLVGLLHGLQDSQWQPADKQELWDIAMKEYNRYFRLFRESGMVFPQLFLRGKIPAVPGRKLTGKVDNIAFFSGLLANDTEKSPWLNLHKYTKRYLGESLPSVLERRTAQRNGVSREEGTHLQQFTQRREWILQQQLRLFNRIGPNATIKSFYEYPSGFSPNLLPGAIAWLQSERSQKFPAITQALIPCLHEILFAYPDTVDVEQIRNLHTTLDRLVVSPEDTSTISYVHDIRAKIRDTVDVRTGSFT